MCWLHVVCIISFIEACGLYKWPCGHHETCICPGRISRRNTQQRLYLGLVYIVVKVDTAFVDGKRDGCEGVHPQLIFVHHPVGINECKFGAIATACSMTQFDYDPGARCWCRHRIPPASVAGRAIDGMMRGGLKTSNLTGVKMQEANLNRAWATGGACGSTERNQSFC